MDEIIQISNLFKKNNDLDHSSMLLKNWFNNKKKN